MKGANLCLSLWLRSALWGATATIAVGAVVGFRQARQRAEEKAVRTERQGEQLSLFQAEEASFEKRLAAAGLPVSAFEADTAITVQPFSKVVQIIEQEFPSVRLHHQLSLQPISNPHKGWEKVPPQVPFTVEAIEKASQGMVPGVTEGVAKTLASAQGATSSKSLVFLTFSLNLNISCEQDILTVFNRLIHLIPGVMIFEYFDIQRKGEFLSSSELPLQQSPSLEVPPYTTYAVAVRGQIATHSDEARVLMGA